MQEGNILIINDSEKVSDLIKIVLSHRGYEISTTFNGKTGIDTFNKKKFDLVLLNINTRDIDPRYLIREFKRKDLDIIVIVLVSSNTIQKIQEAFSEGAFDYLIMPLKPDEIFFSAKRGIMHRRFLINNRRALKGLEERNISLQKQNLMLAKRIEESTKNLTHLYEDLRSTYMRTIKALAQAIDARDHYTHSHSENVSRYAEFIAREMKLDSQTLQDVIDACQLHDVGKIGVHDYILTKPGKLTPEEFEEVKLHALKGAQILEPLTFLENVTKIVKQHHERYDGTGYPQGLKGEQISIGARIMAVADSYDSMVSARPYRMNPLSEEEAIEEIKNNSGTQFDPKIVEAFLRISEKW